MNRKEEIVQLLNFLKEIGVTRTKIEQDLGYSENYINQQLAKGGNDRFLTALRNYRNRIVHGDVAKNNNPVIASAKKNPESDELRVWQEKYIKQIEAENERLLKDKEKLEQLVKDNQEIIKTNLTMVLVLAKTLSVRQIAQATTMLGSLERLEKKKPGTLVAASDKIVDQIEEDTYARDSVAG